MFTCIMLNIIKVIKVCVKFTNFCVNSYYTLRYRVYYILRRKLLNFESLLHFASKSFTFNVTITFWVNYYIFLRKTVSAMTATNFTHQVARSSKLKAFSIYKKFRKISSGNSKNFRSGRERSICQKTHSFTSPSPSLHQKTRCLRKLFCYFLQCVFVRCFPVKQMVVIGMYGYEKSGICMFPSF